MNYEHYINRQTRDARARDLKSRGAVNVRKSSSRGSVLSPEAVLDYTGYTSPNGFGGAAAKYWAVLYTVDWDY